MTPEMLLPESVCAVPGKLSGVRQYIDPLRIVSARFLIRSDFHGYLFGTCISRLPKKLDILMTR